MKLFQPDLIPSSLSFSSPAVPQENYLDLIMENKPGSYDFLIVNFWFLLYVVWGGAATGVWVFLSTGVLGLTCFASAVCVFCGTFPSCFLGGSCGWVFCVAPGLSYLFFCFFFFGFGGFVFVSRGPPLFWGGVLLSFLWGWPGCFFCFFVCFFCLPRVIPFPCLDLTPYIYPSPFLFFVVFWFIVACLAPFLSRKLAL